jgi:hypothetical protein
MLCRLGRLAGRLACAASMLLLAGCMLASGQRASTDIRPDAGNTSVSFIGAEGSDAQFLEIGQPNTRFNVIVTAQVDTGDLQVDMLDGASGTVQLSVQARPDEQVTRSGSIVTDGRGQLHFRINARGARNGGYQILYQRQQ